MNVITRASVICAAATLFLAACVAPSSPPVNYYTLSADASAAPADPENSVVLGIGPLNLPDYLDRSQIVTRGAGSELIVDDFNRWAEPLGTALHQAVAINVDKMLNGVVAVTFPFDSIVQDRVGYRLLGNISKFDADASGLVALEIQWGIAKVEAETVVKPRRARYEAQATEAGDPSAIAKAMSEAVLKLSRDIADEFSSVI